MFKVAPKTFLTPGSIRTQFYKKSVLIIGNVLPQIQSKWLKNPPENPNPTFAIESICGARREGARLESGVTPPGRGARRSARVTSRVKTPELIDPASRSLVPTLPGLIVVLVRAR